MKWNYSLGWALAFSVAALQTVSAATNYWQDANTSFQARSIGDAASINVMVKKGRRLTARLSEMQAEFSTGSNVLSIPLPDGSVASYQFSRTSVMPDELARKYPEIQEFLAFDVNNPSNKGSFDITPQGFHGMFHHDGRWVFIDPENRNDIGNYVAYYGSDALPMDSRQLDEVLDREFLSADITADSILSNRPIIGTELRTYRLALAAAAEYTQIQGGKTNALAAMVTLLGRVNTVYKKDLSIQFELVANNDDLVYTNSSTDPYNNSVNDATINATHLPTVVANSDFDIGHVLNTSNGGVAQLAGVCQNRNKSIGVTGKSNPTGDAFYIDFVAHELGHQLGANHTFNGTAVNCGGRSNRSGTTAWEPGSGSTIMGYAGICGSQNLQPNSDAYFHTGSIEEILSTVSTAGCGVVTTIQNIIPTVDAGADFTIPANTPFKLTGSGSDTDGDVLTYTWEQFDLGTASSGVSTMVDDGSRPLFRSVEPSASPERYFPNLVDYSSGTLQIGEVMPTTNRELNFRLTARDGKGGVATDEMVVTVSTAASALKITAPTSGADLQPDATTVITWEGDSSLAGCASVDILISENGDENFDVAIAQSTPNDGEFGYTVSSTTTSDSVIMLSCSASGLFALSSGGVTAIPVPVSGTATPATDSGGGSSVNALSLYFGLILLVLIRRFRGREVV
jgi:hypothetical protein